MKEEKYQDLEDNVMSLAVQDAQAALDLILIRYMMRDRDITVKDLALETGLSQTWIRKVLHARAYDEAEKYYPIFDKLEDGISSLSKKRDWKPMPIGEVLEYAVQQVLAGRELDS